MRAEHTLHPLPTFPVYSIGFLSDDKVVLGGGGGAGRSGVKNQLVSSYCGFYGNNKQAFLSPAAV
jgi:hypothetical protein